MADKYKTFGEMKPYGGKYAKIKQKMKTGQTENVKKLTTSDDAYSPEKMYVFKMGKSKAPQEVPEGTKGAKYFQELSPYAQSRFYRNKRKPSSQKAIKQKKVGKLEPRKSIKDRPKPKLALKGGGRAYGRNS